MSLFGVLNTGASGLRAGSAGAQVASQNISNAGTDGYSRQQVSLEALGPRPLAGVRVTGSRRVVDQLVERRLLGARASAGQTSTRADSLAVLDAVFSTGPGSVGDALQALQTAMGDLSTSPGDGTARRAVLAAAEGVANAFSSAGSALTAAHTDINERISTTVDDVNTSLREVASLGQQIAEHENATGSEAGELRDRRDELLRGISERIPVRVIEHENGGVSVLLASQKQLVSEDGRVNELIAVPDATSGNVSIEVVSAGASEDVTSLITTGRIAGFIEARDGGIADARAGLDALARDVAVAYDAVHAAGFGLDGGTGRNLFDVHPTVAGAAEAMAVSLDVSGNPDAIAASSTTAGLPGNNQTALDLLALADQQFAAGGTDTATGAYASLVGAAGSAVAGANRAMEHASAVADQVAAVRDGISGVSTDEEMISLMQFQRAYQASLRVVSVADEMLGELMMMKR